MSQAELAQELHTKVPILARGAFAESEAFTSKEVTAKTHRKNLNYSKSYDHKKQILLLTVNHN